MLSACCSHLTVSRINTKLGGINCAPDAKAFPFIVRAPTLIMGEGMLPPFDIEVYSLYTVQAPTYPILVPVAPYLPLRDLSVRWTGGVAHTLAKSASRHHVKRLLRHSRIWSRYTNLLVLFILAQGPLGSCPPVPRVRQTGRSRTRRTR